MWTLSIVYHTEWNSRGPLSQPPALGLLPDLDEPAVKALLGHQRIVGPALDDPPLIHHHDLVRIPDGGESVGDGDEGLARCQLPDGGQEEVLVLRVHAGRGLIQNDDRGVLQNGPGDGEALLLAAGEKQRLSIARALLKDAPIVLLDEATASLDPENEVLIQRAISALVAEKTVIVIAHRLQSIMGADHIIVLEAGRVREQGNHEQLLRRGGTYARLWAEQQTAAGWNLR